jgi:hypothetical protein
MRSPTYKLRSVAHLIVILDRLKMKLNKRIVLSAVIVAALVSTAFTFASRYDFYLFAFIAIIIVPTFLLTSLIYLALIFIAKIKKRESLIVRTKWLRIVVLMSFIIGLTVPGSFSLWEYDKKISMIFCESLIPILQDYKATHGNYPEEIAKLRLNNNVPRLLTKYKYFSSRGQFYRFRIVNIGPQAYWTIYDSREKIWKGYDPIAEGFEF